jgi:hypothetical protein
MDADRESSSLEYLTSLYYQGIGANYIPTAMNRDLICRYGRLVP